MKYPYKIKVQDSIMCIWNLHGGDRFYHLYSYPELQFITSFAVNGRGPEEYISTGGFCLDEQHIYVFDTSRARLSIFRKDSLMQQRISPARIIDYPQVGIPILNFCSITIPMVRCPRRQQYTLYRKFFRRKCSQQISVTTLIAYY